MRPVDGSVASNVSATTAGFLLAGGLYGASCVATGYGTVKLQRLAADGSTYLSVSSATDFAANGYATVNLPAGTYRWTVASASAIYAAIDRIPGE